MLTLHVTSLSSGAGKTAICAGLGTLLADKGKKIGYFKPTIGNTNDSDPAFLKQMLSLPDPVADIGPLFAGEDALKAGVKTAFDKVTAGKDIVLVESKNQCVRQLLPGATLIVAGFSEIDILPNFTTCGGSSVNGFILNKIPVSQINSVVVLTAPLQKQGVNVLGILPEDKALLTFSLGQLAEIVEGQLTGSPEMNEVLAPNFMLGAMSVGSALPYFSRKPEKVAILRAERADMQMAALATDTRALVLYGDTPMNPMVRLRAGDKKVPVITTKLKVQTITGRLEEKILSTRFNQPGKVPRITELMSRNIDLPAMYKTLGII